MLTSTPMSMFWVRESDDLVFGNQSSSVSTRMLALGNILLAHFQVPLVLNLKKKSRLLSGRSIKKLINFSGPLGLFTRFS